MTLSYKAKVICWNCGSDKEQEIPKGLEVAEHECVVCGCKTVRLG